MHFRGAHMSHTQPMPRERRSCEREPLGLNRQSYLIFHHFDPTPEISPPRTACPTARLSNHPIWENVGMDSPSLVTAFLLRSEQELTSQLAPAHRQQCGRRLV